MDTQMNNTATPPDRLNEDWRFGQPHRHAQALLARMAESSGAEGSLRLEGAPADRVTTTPAQDWTALPTIGSDYLLEQRLSKPLHTLSLRIAPSVESAPLTIRCEAQGLFLPCIHVVVESGAHAHVVEEHVHHSGSTMLCLRQYVVMPGASLSVELREQGCGNSSQALNITHLSCRGDCRVRHISTHSSHSWAREETTAELAAHEGAAPELLLLSANRLQADQTLDQRTRQLHLSPGGKSRLLYKNVLDDHATAVFGGNIRVELGAHDTDAYLSNLNMMLSEQATVHSLPELEILADRVRCSHGSATAPIDPEQLFYLLARGVSEPTARTLLAEGFLSDVWEQFRLQD